MAPRSSTRARAVGIGAVCRRRRLQRRPLAVAVVTADCLPILMSSRDGRVVAALHNGWQGLVAGIVGAAVARFNARGVASADIRSPSVGIKACCCEVSAGFIEALQVGHGRTLGKARRASWSQRRPSPSGRPDSLRPSQGRRAGRLWLRTWWPSVASCSGRRRRPADRSQRAVCTYCSGDAFAGHRRRQRLGEEKRQQYAWIALKP